MLPGDTITMYSKDRCSKESRYMELPSEVYHKVTPMGLPPHELRLKKVFYMVFLILFCSLFATNKNNFLGMRRYVAAKSQRARRRV